MYPSLIGFCFDVRQSESFVASNELRFNEICKHDKASNCLAYNFGIDRLNSVLYVQVFD